MQLGRTESAPGHFLCLCSSVTSYLFSSAVHGFSWCFLQQKLKVDRANEKPSTLYRLVQLLCAISLGWKQMEQINHIGFVTVTVIELWFMARLNGLSRFYNAEE